MPSLQVLISTDLKVQTTAVMVCKSSVKQRQYISHYQLGHVSPGHAPVVDVCVCVMFPPV